MLRKLLNIVDRLYKWLHHLKPVGSIFYTEIKIYKSAPLNLSDGTILRCGDKICVLHFNNERIALMHNESKGNAGIAFVRHVTLSLSELANKLHNDKAYEGVVALGGITWLHREGAKKMGFDSYPMRGFWRLLWLRIKFSLYIRSVGKRQMSVNPVRKRGLLMGHSNRVKIKPQALWMSKTRLLRHYNLN